MKKTSNYNMQMRILSTESPRLISKIANSFKEDDITCANVITYLVNFSHFNHASQNRYLCTAHELKSGQPLPHSQWKLHSRFFFTGHDVGFVQRHFPGCLFLGEFGGSSIRHLERELLRSGTLRTVEEKRTRSHDARQR